MQWIYDYQLFLFDLDGLLVNTEEIHFLAYKQMCTNHGYNLDWDFNRYCQAAHYDSEALRREITAYLPGLLNVEPNWSVLYAEKQKEVIRLFNEGAVHLMPGVDSLLQALETAQISRCVVTHSPDELVSAVRQQNPILNTIPHWITRHHYSHPKPNPECYQIAIAKLAKTTDKVIGFEDTPRGLRALLGTNAKPVLICQVQYPEIPAFLAQGVTHYTSFDAIPKGTLSP
jgi:beta-phosphoglucomutase